VKKREGTDVLETKIKVSKTQKETGRDYKFSKTHQTTKVKFYDYNPYEDVKNLLVEVPIEKIVSNSYSLNYAEYMKDETEEEQYEDDVVVKTLGEVCNIDYGTRIVKGNNTEGDYPVYGSGRAMFSTNTFNREGYNILIGRFALSLECVRFINEKIFLNDSGLSIKPKTDILLHKYIGYYLLHNQSIIYNCARGTAQKNLEMDIFKSIKIPIPSLERQQEIVKYLDFIYEKANKTSNEKIAELKQLNEFCLNNQKIFGKNVVKELGDVFKEVKTGKDVVATERKKGEYPFYGANGIIDYVDSYIFDGKYLLTARTGSLGSLHISNGKFWCSGDVHRMEFENDTLLSYTYYYLQTIDFQKFRTGSAHPKLSGSSLKSIKIHIPTLERQKEIVEYCEYNDKLVKQLEKEIENNKKQAQQFITGIVKAQVKEDVEEQTETSSVNTEPIDEVQNEIVSVEEEVIIEPKPKVKKIVKKIKKPLLIVEDEDVVV
jgi:type I restriction enzyme S subunit